MRWLGIKKYVFLVCCFFNVLGSVGLIGCKRESVNFSLNEKKYAASEKTHTFTSQDVAASDPQQAVPTIPLGNALQGSAEERVEERVLDTPSKKANSGFLRSTTQGITNLLKNPRVRYGAATVTAGLAAGVGIGLATPRKPPPLAKKNLSKTEKSEGSFSYSPVLELAETPQQKIDTQDVSTQASFIVCAVNEGEALLEETPPAADACRGGCTEDVSAGNTAVSWCVLKWVSGLKIIPEKIGVCIRGCVGYFRQGYSTFFNYGQEARFSDTAAEGCSRGIQENGHQDISKGTEPKRLQILIPIYDASNNALCYYQPLFIDPVVLSQVLSREPMELMSAKDMEPQLIQVRIPVYNTGNNATRYYQSIFIDPVVLRQVMYARALSREVCLREPIERMLTIIVLYIAQGPQLQFIQAIIPAWNTGNNAFCYYQLIFMDPFLLNQAMHARALSREICLREHMQARDFLPWDAPPDHPPDGFLSRIGFIKQASASATAPQGLHKENTITNVTYCVLKCVSGLKTIQKNHEDEQDVEHINAIDTYAKNHQPIVTLTSISYLALVDCSECDFRSR